MRANELATVRHEARDSSVIATLEGEVDSSNATMVRDEILRVMSNEALGLVIDLSDARYFDSAGIQMLFELAERLNSRGQTLSVCAPPDGLLRGTLDLFEMDRAIPLADSVEEGLVFVKTSRAGF